MTIIELKVECDSCHRVFDGLKEKYEQGQEEQFCLKCAEGDSPR